jgi:hypothetical protein
MNVDVSLNTGKTVPHSAVNHRYASIADRNMDASQVGSMSQQQYDLCICVSSVEVEKLHGLANL